MADGRLTYDEMVRDEEGTALLDALAQQIGAELGTPAGAVKITEISMVAGTRPAEDGTAAYVLHYVLGNKVAEDQVRGQAPTICVRTA